LELGVGGWELGSIVWLPDITGYCGANEEQVCAAKINNSSWVKLLLFLLYFTQTQHTHTFIYVLCLCLMPVGWRTCCGIFIRLYFLRVLPKQKPFNVRGVDRPKDEGVEEGGRRRRRGLSGTLFHWP